MSYVTFSFFSLITTTHRRQLATATPEGMDTSPRRTEERSSTTKIKNDLVWGVSHVSSDTVWEQLLQEAGGFPREQRGKLVAMEAGMHNAKQCLLASRQGLQAHCFEPSPKSYQRIREQIQAEREASTRYLTHVYNMAASPKSHEQVEFSSTGGTGDHVGAADMYSMKHVSNKNHDAIVATVQVPTIALDDMVDEITTAGNGEMFLLKVDTQGFEPSVFRGLERSLQAQTIPFILTEYWPRGIDLLANETRGSCSAARLLERLSLAGYDLYQMTVIGHPDAGKRRLYVNQQHLRPVNDFVRNCQWYVDLEQQNLLGNKDYRMGFWTDVLAVGPGAIDRFLKQPTTLVGKVLACKGAKDCLPDKPINPMRCRHDEKAYDPACTAAN